LADKRLALSPIAPGKRLIEEKRREIDAIISLPVVYLPKILEE
jgi:hypothetical protein